MSILATSSLSWPYQLGDLTGLLFFEVPFVWDVSDPLRVCLSWPLTTVGEAFFGADPLVSSECPFEIDWMPPSAARIVFLPVRLLFESGLTLFAPPAGCSSRCLCVFCSFDGFLRWTASSPPASTFGARYAGLLILTCCSGIVRMVG